MTFLRNLRRIIQKKGFHKIIWIDESGFKSHSYRSYAWSKRGHRSLGDRQGRRENQTNLIAAKRGKDLLAPILYQTSTTALWVLHWLKEHLFKVLEKNSTLILDNAGVHKKDEIYALAKEYGHDVLFLPSYSPDFNPIEKVFAILKKRRELAPKNTTIDQIVNSYGSFLE